MAVTLWNAEYHHFAFLEEEMGSQSSISFCLANFSSICHWLSNDTSIYRKFNLHGDSQDLFSIFFFCWVSFGSGWSKDDIMPSWFGGNWALWISVVGWVSPRFWRRLFVISRGKGLHVLCNLDLEPVRPLAGHSSCPPLFNTHPLEKTAQPIFKVERENHVKEKTHEWEYILKISWKYL